MTLTLAERISEGKLEKSLAQPFNVRQLAKKPERLNFTLSIQRNLCWTESQRTSLIESVLLGYPIPPIYTLKSADGQLWLLDGKQRMNTLITYCNEGWALSELEEVYGEDISGMKFSELPEEFRELIEEQYITFYQFETLTTDQRDNLFFRLNNGKSLSSIELTRSVLGSDNLDFINKLANSTFIKKAQLSETQLDKFVDQELILQTIAIITGRSKDLSGKKMKEFAVELRANGLTEDEKFKIETVYDYLSEGFADIDNKTAKKVLKKTDIIGIVGATWECEEKPEVFANLIVPFISNQRVGSQYSQTKNSKSASPENVSKRITMIQGVVGVARLEKQQSKQEPVEQVVVDTSNSVVISDSFISDVELISA